MSTLYFWSIWCYFNGQKCDFLSKTRTFISDPKPLNSIVSDSYERFFYFGSTVAYLSLSHQTHTLYTWLSSVLQQCTSCTLYINQVYLPVRHVPLRFPHKQNPPPYLIFPNSHLSSGSPRLPRPWMSQHRERSVNKLLRTFSLGKLKGGTSYRRCPRR